MAAVLETSGVPLAARELYGAVGGGRRLDDPACDLAIAAALASAASGVPAPRSSAFVGEIGLTGTVRPASGMAARVAAARAAGISTVYAAEGPTTADVRVVPVHRVSDAVGCALAAGRRP